MPAPETVISVIEDLLGQLGRSDNDALGLRERAYAVVRIIKAERDASDVIRDLNLPPDEDEGVECPKCNGIGRIVARFTPARNVWAEGGIDAGSFIFDRCPRCNGEGRLFGDAAASHLEDLEERAADRKGGPMMLNLSTAESKALHGLLAHASPYLEWLRDVDIDDASNIGDLLERVSIKLNEIRESAQRTT